MISDVVTEHSLLKVDANTLVRRLSIDVERLRPAFIASEGSRWFVRWPNGSTTDCDHAEGVVVLSSGKAACQLTVGGRRCVACEGALGPLFDWTSHITATRSGNDYAYWGMMRGAQIGARSESAGTDGIRLSLSIPLLDKAAFRDRYWAHFTDRAYGPADDYGYVALTPESDFAYSCEKDGERWVIQGEQVWGGFRNAGFLAFCGRKCVFWACKKDHWELYLDGEAIDRSDEGFGGSQPVATPAGGLAYWRRAAGLWEIVVDGKVRNRVGELIPFVSSPVVAENGAVAYAAETPGGVAAFVDGECGTVYDSVSSVVLSRDGKHCAYKACRGETEYLVRDHTIQFEHESSPSQVNDPRVLDDIPTLSADGTRAACVGRKGPNRFAVWDGVAGPATNGTRFPPVFVSDGSRCVYVAYVDGDEALFVDHQEISRFDRTWPADSYGPHWTGEECISLAKDGAHWFCARRGEEVLAIRIG